MSASEIVNKVWNYAHVLRDDGVGYGDYVEQITYLIFLKMADERASLTPTLSQRERGNNDVPGGSSTPMFIAHAQDVKGGAGQYFIH